MCNREAVAYRSPSLIANDIYSIQRYLNGPVFIIGDIRQPGEDYTEELLEAMGKRGVNGPIVLELFGPAGEDFFKKVSKVIPQYNIQISPESHDEEVRYAFGKPWRNVDIENTIKASIENNCQRFDLFYMIGLPKQDYLSVMGTVAYMRKLFEEFDGGGKVHPHISPLAPFIDPGSMVFERPEDYGYKLLYRTLEEHRQALLSPAWSYMLNYETNWLTRGEITDVTYEAALGFNESKREFGLISSQAADQVKDRIRKDINIVKELDRQMEQYGQASWYDEEKELCLASTVSKRELEWPARSFTRSMPRILWNLIRN
jgi:radical SAM superfamily enzyme YgiQ (UPF0313 family)